MRLLSLTHPFMVEFAGADTNKIEPILRIAAALGLSEVIAKGKVYFLSEYLRKKSMFSEQSGEAEDRRVRIVKVMLEKPQGLLFNAKVEVKISTK